MKVTVTVLFVVENRVGGKLLSEQSLLPQLLFSPSWRSTRWSENVPQNKFHFSRGNITSASFDAISKHNSEWCLEMASKLAEVILLREKWNLF